MPTNLTTKRHCLFHPSGCLTKPDHLIPYQNSVYLNLLEATEGKVFDHHQSRRAAFAHIIAVQVAIAISVPWWRFLGLVR
jgi:hypothetical protein